MAVIHGKIIARTPPYKPQFCVTGGVIVQETEDQFIVHNAEFSPSGEILSLCWGHYFPKRDPNALARAMQVFAEKVAKWYVA
jgi:hypothetical protein